MKYCRLKSATASAAVVKLAVAALRGGGVAVLPTDTIYGLSGLAASARAIRRIQSLKRREAPKPLLILVASRAMLKSYVFLSAWQEARLRRYWRPGVRPTTVVLRHRGRLPRALTAGSAGLAVRLPKSKFLIRIIRKLGEPLISTSLNISGEAPVSDLRRLTRLWPDKKLRPDLAVDAGSLKRRRPSRLIDLRAAGSQLVLRK